MGVENDARAPANGGQRDAWQAAWLLLLPLALVLLYIATSRVLTAHNAVSMSAPDGSLRDLARWLWGFTVLRCVAALLVGWGLQRWLCPRRRWAFLPFALGLFGALAGAAAWRQGQPVATLLQHWLASAGDQAWLLLAASWSDAGGVALMVLLLGTLLRWSPATLRPLLVRLAQAACVLLCLLLAFGYAAEWATGQPTSARVVLFALRHPQDTAPMLRAEVTPWRLAGVAAALLGALAWQWRVRALARAPMTARAARSAALLLALLGSAAVLLPAPRVGMAELQRSRAGSLLPLALSLRPSPLEQARDELARRYPADTPAPWFSDSLRLVPRHPQAAPRNVVIVMMESMRAESTSLATPGVPTTPFLQSLAAKGLQVPDMNAVIPRTAAAWTAILAGSYPLSNEATSRWAAGLDHGTPPTIALPRALRGLGYATGFFTPTGTDYLDDRTLLAQLGFAEVFDERQLNGNGAPRVNYLGWADEVMVEPILAWSRKQQQAQRPFLTVVMTNVGHHDYRTPPDWPRVDFPGVAPDSTLADYYNCLRYIDSVMARLMDGYARLGLLDNTVFVFVGDHGQMFGEHGLKQSFNAIYQPGLHVPALVYAPGLIAPGQVAQGPRQQVDIVPTVLDLLGLRMEDARLPGLSLLQPVPPERPLFFASSIEGSELALRHGQRKYIYHFGREPMQVFDLAADPQELRPLAGVPDPVLAEARSAMLTWQAEVERSALGPALD